MTYTHPPGQSTLYLFLKVISFLFLRVLYSYQSMYHVCAWCLRGSEECVIRSATGRKQVLLTTEDLSQAPQHRLQINYNFYYSLNAVKVVLTLYCVENNCKKKVNTCSILEEFLNQILSPHSLLNSQIWKRAESIWKYRVS